MSDFVKLAELVGKEFTIEKVWPAEYILWDGTTKTMLKSKEPTKGYRKTYNLETSKGKVGMGATMVGNLMEAIQENGSANIIGRSFSLASNGQTGKDIRYFVNAIEAPQDEDTVDFGDYGGTS